MVFTVAKWSSSGISPMTYTFRMYYNAVLIKLHSQRVSIRETLVTMGAAEWFFIATRHFILVVIMLHSQWVSFREILVTMGTAEWLFYIQVPLRDISDTKW